MPMLIFVVILGAGYWISTRPPSVGKKIVLGLLFVSTIFWLLSLLCYLSKPDIPLVHFFEAALGILFFVAGVQLFRLKPVGLKLVEVKQTEYHLLRLSIMSCSPDIFAADRLAEQHP